MPEPPIFDAREFATLLEAMIDDELFAAMRELERASEEVPAEKRDESEIFARIALAETAIEDRFPGQLLAPYKEWKQRHGDR